MPRFMVETSHEAQPPEVQPPAVCLRELDAAVAQGSHYVTHAEFGCEYGVHKAWIFVDAEDKEDARRMVPAPSRARALIVEVRRYTPDQIRALHAEGQT